MIVERSLRIFYLRDARISGVAVPAFAATCIAAACTPADTQDIVVAIFRLITFFIHAVVAAMASMLVAVFTRVVPAFVALAVVVGVAVAVCTSCGMGSLALRRHRKHSDE